MRRILVVECIIYLGVTRSLDLEEILRNLTLVLLRLNQENKALRCCGSLATSSKTARLGSY